MGIPYRGKTGNGTYFITASCADKQHLLQSQNMAELFIHVLLHYRQQNRFLLHEFVVMPNHFHLLITPMVSLEKAIQFIKGGFSYRAKRELSFQQEIWQSSFYDHRIRDSGEYLRCRHYIHMNPVRKGLVPTPEEFPHGSAKLKLDEVPQWLKPAA